MTVKMLGGKPVGGRAADEAGRECADRPPGIEDAARARADTIRSLAQVLEVLDGRRPVEHLLSAVADEVYSQVMILLQRMPRGRTGRPTGVEAARLRRVHLQQGSPRRADYFGTFARGDRVRAVAGRIEIRWVSLPGKGGPRHRVERWVLVELSIV